MQAVLAALLGGFVGALVTGMLSVWLEHRRRRRALRVAARLVAEELHTIEVRLHAAVASGAWREIHARILTHGEWDEYRDVFAADLPRQHWEDVNAAYGLVESVNELASLRGSSERLTEVDREVLENAAQSAGAAAQALESGWSGEPGGPGRFHGRASRVLLRHP